MLTALLYRILPQQTFIRWRRKYRLGLLKLQSPIKTQEIRDLLSNGLGLQPGSSVLIHSSVDFLHLDMDAFRLLETLLDIVGPEGTLLFPCWHFNYRAEDYLRSQGTFDVRRSPSALGMLSEIARRHPQALRSLHPTSSIVAIGKQAAYFTRDHHLDIYPCGKMSPYYRLKEAGGKIIGLGVDNFFMSFVHCPEDVLPESFPRQTRLKEIFKSKVIDTQGREMTVNTLAAHPMIKYNDIRAFCEQYIPREICRNLSVRGNRFFTADAQGMYDQLLHLAQKGTTIYTRNWPVEGRE